MFGISICYTYEKVQSFNTGKQHPDKLWHFSVRNNISSQEVFGGGFFPPQVEKTKLLSGSFVFSEEQKKGNLTFKIVTWLLRKRGQSDICCI